MELERLNGLRRRLESSNVEGNTARNRFGRSTSDKGSAFADYIVDKLPYSTGGRTEHQQRLMFLRSAFVIYILFLHIVVFIKLSFWVASRKFIFLSIFECEIFPLCKSLFCNGVASSSFVMQLVAWTNSLSLSIYIYIYIYMQRSCLPLPNFMIGYRRLAHKRKIND